MRLPIEKFDDCIAFSWLEPRVEATPSATSFILDKRQLADGILSFLNPDGFVVLLWVSCRRRRLRLLTLFRLRNRFHLLTRTFA